MNTILIADDESSIRTILSKSMEKQGYEVVRAQTGLEALEILRTRPIDVAIVDVRMPEMTGLDLLTHQNEFPSKPSIFVITAQDTMENAIEAMKRGAYDYLTKPFDLDEISLLVGRALENRKLKSELENLKKDEPKINRLTLVGKSKIIQDVYKTIGRVADQEVTVLIEGESGTGKEMVAKAIHYQGKRKEYPFVAVNCSAIPGNLLESELFGYKKGSFTGANTDRAGKFEQANFGTLFLDEIGEMPLELQAKMLRVLQEKEVQRLGDSRVIPLDVRVVAATNQKLQERVKKGLFREDLYFRLNVVPIRLPALRERKADIKLLANHFLARHAEESREDPKSLSKEAIDYLQDLPYPGNIRELENLIKRVLVLTSGPVLEKWAFESLHSGLKGSMPIMGLNFKEVEERIELMLFHLFENADLEPGQEVFNQITPLLERPLIRLVLKKTRGNQIQAAKVLGINRNTLRKKIKELGVERRGLLRK